MSSAVYFLVADALMRVRQEEIWERTNATAVETTLDLRDQSAIARRKDVMSLQDPLNTSERDGAACAECGDDAVVGLLLQGHAHELPLCDKCATDQVTDCPGCEQTIWCRDGIRLFSSSRLYCQRCVDSIPGLILPGLDQVNEVRR